MNNFKRFGGFEIEDLGGYVREYLTKHKDVVNVYVGTDSDQYRKHTQFATVVLLYHEGKGAHYIFRKFASTDDNGRKTKIKDIFSRMFAEANYSYEIAEYLEKELEGYVTRKGENKLCIIDVDINPLPRWKSNVAYSAVTGFLKGFNYDFRTKPNAWAASGAADLVVRR